jgi:RimJ/RimL family protein N-acetyltransferase
MTSTTGTAGTAAPPAVPVLTTARLVLRGPRLADFDDAYAMWRDPIVIRHIGGRAQSREEVWARLLRYVGHWALFGWGFWTIETKDGARFVGECGFADFHRELEPGFGDTPEHGWALAPWAHGQGFGREAVTATLAWADAQLSGSRTVCMIDPANAPSLALAAAVGYRETARTTYKGDPTILLARPRLR